MDFHLSCFTFTAGFNFEDMLPADRPVQESGWLWPHIWQGLAISRPVHVLAKSRSSFSRRVIVAHL